MIGEVLGDRFVLEAAIGAGGMGTVHRAFDRTTGRAVAVKVGRADAQRDDARFEDEIALLAELSHPGIVGYIGHGVTGDGRPFLAMELLEGEDLGARLARGPLSTDEALAVVRGAAEALVTPHARGIVHRDLKPANLFLRDGSSDQLVVLDFGIARGFAASAVRTATGLVVGTPEYMAPEQAQGQRDVTPAADVFALGCVLYECLAGRSPFASEHLAATLAKILFEEPRALESLRRELSPSVCRLVRSMLVKDRAERIADASALLAELGKVSHVSHASMEADVPSSALGGAELELVTVILATPECGAPSADTLEAGPSTFAERAIAIARAHLRSPELVVEPLGDGSVLIALGQQGESPLDQVLLSLGCAHVLRAAFSDAHITVTTSRRVAGARTAMGDALERAGHLLPRAVGAKGVLLDDVTAELLHGHARTERLDSGVIVALDEQAAVDESRLLLGKPTPCVGREHELATLEGLALAAFDEGVARAALVLAGAGVGKSRVRHELFRRLETALPGGLTVLSARGELLRAGSPYGIVGSALRRLLGGTVVEVVASIERLTPELAPALRLFLGELTDTPFPEEGSHEGSTVLRAARQDPRLMQAKLGEAFGALLSSLAKRAPVAFVIEDLHWGDRPSIELLGRVLREELPLFVVAFARPEVKETFSEIWPGKALELPLPPLGRRACQKLADRVAGDRLGPATIARIVEQAAGNALWLEELIRAASEGAEDSTPETVLAMVQARVSRLEPFERRVLRAASVFGETFRRDGVSALLSDDAQLDAALESLGRREVLEVVADHFRFRHALMRDAAYGLLTDEDRRLGHRLAAAWLSRREPDPLPIAEHYLRADEPVSAAPWLLRAVERAYERDDFDGTHRLSRRSSGMPDEYVGQLASYAASAAVMRWDWDGADEAAARALELLPVGARCWIRAHRTRGTIAAYHHRPDHMLASIESLLAVTPADDARLEYGDTLLHLASASAQTGDTTLARKVFERARDTLAPLLSRYPGIHAWQNLICCTLLRHTDDDLATQLFLLREADRLHEVIGAPRSMVVLTRDVLGEVLSRAGQLGEGVAVLRRAHEDALRVGASYLLSHSRLALANGLLAAGQLDEAETLVSELLATRGISEGYQAMANDVLAQVLSARGRNAEAALRAREAIDKSSHTPVRRWLMSAHLAEALAALDRGEEGFAVASEALSEMVRAGGGGYAETSLVLSTAEVALSTGRRELAVELASRLRERLKDLAASFVEPEVFASFLQHAPGITRLRALEQRLKG